MEPRRLLEENPTDIERALLNAGAAYRCSPSGRAKTLTALGIAGSAALSAAVGASATSVVAKFGWAKVVMAITALGAVTAIPAGYYAWKHAHRVEVPTVALPQVQQSQPVVSVERERSEAAPAVQPAVPAPEDANVKGAPLAKLEPKTDASTALSEELSALDSARSMLSRGDSIGALTRLDSYNRSFPKGRLQLEAEVLRIDALVRSGQKDVAKKRAQAFLAKHPNSVLASRVRGLLQLQ